MKQEFDVRKHQADVFQLPQTLIARILTLEEEIEGFDSDEFAHSVLRDKIEDIEEENNLVLDWSIKPVYQRDRKV